MQGDRRACPCGVIESTMGEYPRGTGLNPVEGYGHFFAHAVSSIFRHRQECPEITYMAMGFRPHTFPVGGMYMKGTGRQAKVKKNRSLLFSFAS